MLGAVTRLRKIAVSAVLHGIGVTVAELVFHGVVPALGSIIRFLGTFSAVGIILKMVADTFWHGIPSRLGYAESLQRAMIHLFCS
jgi:hypothetical protein